MNHPCLCLIAPISQHIMLPQSTVATVLIFNWVDGRVLIKRVEAGTEFAIGEEQCGFMQGIEDPWTKCLP